MGLKIKTSVMLDERLHSRVRQQPNSGGGSQRRFNRLLGQRKVGQALDHASTAEQYIAAGTVYVDPTRRAGKSSVVSGSPGDYSVFETTKGGVMAAIEFATERGATTEVMQELNRRLTELDSSSTP